MAYRAKPYFVALDNQQMFRIPAARWHQWAADGRLKPIKGMKRVAKPARLGVVWLENGELHYPPDPIAPYMVLSCQIIEQRCVPSLTPEQLQREIQDAYGGID